VFRVTVLSKQFEPLATKTEKYYGAKYSTEKIDPAVISRWKNECRKEESLYYPEPNEFIPKRLEMKTRVDKPGIIPSVINETDLSLVWYLQDNEFLLPKAIVSVEMYR
jgi:insulysin